MFVYGVWSLAAIQYSICMVGSLLGAWVSWFTLKFLKLSVHLLYYTYDLLYWSLACLVCLTEVVILYKDAMDS